MSNESIRVCDLKHIPKFKLIHKGRENLFEELVILVCDKCESRSPFNDSRLEREPIRK